MQQSTPGAYKKFKAMEESKTCEKCNKTFKDIKYLKQHQNKRVPCDSTHICKKCGVEFTTAYNLRKHHNKKLPCVPTEVPVLDPTNSENKCKFCGNNYATPYSLRRHQSTCPMKDNQTALIQLVLNKLDKMEEENKELKQQLKIQPMNQTVNNNNLTVNQNLYVNVTICNFGNEDLSKLDQQGVIDLLKGQVEDFMPKMIEYIHANPNHPEFHNVFYDPVRKKALVFTQNKDNKLTWQFEDIERVSKLLTEKIKEHIHPLNGPYFNSLSKNDIETANKIPQILCTNWQTPVIVEGTKTSLTKVTQNEGFMDQVSVLE